MSSFNNIIILTKIVCVLLWRWQDFILSSLASVFIKFSFCPGKNCNSSLFPRRVTQSLFSDKKGAYPVEKLTSSVGVLCSPLIALVYTPGWRFALLSLEYMDGSATLSPTPDPTHQPLVLLNFVYFAPKKNLTVHSIQRWRIRGWFNVACYLLVVVQKNFCNHIFLHSKANSLHIR